MRYEAPTSINAAVKLLAGKGLAKVLAGGTDLLVQMKTDRIEPDLVVDVKRIPGMRDIAAKGGGFRIGAAVSGAELGEHKALKKAWPGVVEAANLIGSHADPGPRHDRRQSLQRLAGGRQRAGADRRRRRRRDRGPQGQARRRRSRQVGTGPGKTSLAEGRDRRVPSCCRSGRRKSGDAYLRFIPRTEMDIAVVGVGVNLTLDAKGVCTAARVALGAVAAQVLLVPEAAKALIGTKLDDAALDKLAAAARPPASRSTTSAARSNSASRSPACWRAARPPSR